jgi:tetratricopeptide (TPR) repeat protein
MQRAALLGVRWWSRVAARSLRELGESALQREQFEEAARLFGQALRELDAQHQQKEQQQQQQQQQQEADEEEEEERLQLLNRQGFALASQGALEPARAVLTRCRDVAARRGDARALATAQINLAAVLLQQGQGEEALALLREARAAREQHAGLAAPETLDALADETRALLALGRPDEAWPLAQEAAQRLPSCPGDAALSHKQTCCCFSLL